MSSDENVSGNVMGREQERLLINKAKQEHKQTTASAQRALKLAVTTVDVAQSAVVELHRQGEQLELADRGVTQIDEEVKEASSIIRFMRRLCCFAVLTSCCSCMDGDAARDATRMARVRQMDQHRYEVRCEAAMRHAAKQQQVEELVRKAQAGEPEGKEARSELLGDTGKIRAQRAHREQQRLGEHLPEADRQEVLQETQVQDECLDRIAVALKALNVCAATIHDELVEQAPKLGRLGERVDVAHDNLHSLGRQAGEMAGQLPRRGEASAGLGRQASAAAAAAKYSAAVTRALE